MTTGQVGGSDWCRTYRPFDDQTGLFIMFADVSPDEGHISDFANKYGCLLDPHDPSTHIWIPDGPQNYFPGRGETLAFWQQEIRTMHLALTIWNAIRSDSSQLVANLFKAIGADSQPDSLLALWLKPNSRDAQATALHVLAKLVDQHLHDHVSSQMRSSGEPTSLQLTYIPRNLVGALWLQLALAIDTKKSFVKCANCGQPFELSQDLRSRRSSSRYCRPACRVNAYRERIAQAQRLHAQSVPSKEIAKRLQTTTERVRKWLSLAP